MACNLCGGEEIKVYWSGVTDYEYGLPGQWDIVECSRCGLKRLDPMPTYKETLDFYPENYVQYHPRLNMSRIVAPLYRHFVVRQGRQMFDLVGPEAKIIDIGCGCGEFIGILKEEFPGWDIVGVEPNPQAAQTGRDMWGLDIRTGSLDELDLPRDHFDLVIFTHVVEHVTEPLKALTAIRDLLKPGGWLFGETDNLECLDAKVLKRHWGLLHVPRHLYFFTPDTVDQMLRAAGFDQVQLQQTYNPGGWAVGWQFLLEEKLFNRITPGRTSYYPLLLLAAMPLMFIQLAVKGGSCAVRFISQKTAD